VTARERLRVILGFALNYSRPGYRGHWRVGRWSRGRLVARWERPGTFRKDAHPALTLVVEDGTREGERFRFYTIRAGATEIAGGGDWGSWRGWVDDLAIAIAEAAERAPFMHACDTCKGAGSADYFHCSVCDGQGMLDIREAL
jgi:hypothetical protein